MLASPATTVEGIIRAAQATDAEWGPPTGMNLPALRTTVGEMAQALERVAGKTATDLLDWTPDPAILRLVRTWPGNVAFARAHALGLAPDSDFESKTPVRARCILSYGTERSPWRRRVSRLDLVRARV